MRLTTTNQAGNPAFGASVNERSVIGFTGSDQSRSPLDTLIREGARKMLQAALEKEVQEFLEQHSSRVDEQGHRQVVRNGYLPPREIVTGAGPLGVSQPRVRDKSVDVTERVRFSSSILPPYLRKSKSIEERIPWLYLKGISTGDFSKVLQSLIGSNASGFSANVVVRLKEQWSQEYDAWSRRNLSGKHYVYIWADGIYANVRLEDEANSRQCLLVLMGATAEGEKELIAAIDGYRESKQSWMEVLLDLKQRGLTIEPKLAILSSASPLVGASNDPLWYNP
uniref:IS256 family transposase n=1 Tax=Schlesneria paludicola TaxID=360056 RepID=UPI00029B572B|nr:IS256 family transposase [Schlesneria paludicola]